MAGEGTRSRGPMSERAAVLIFALALGLTASHAAPHAQSSTTLPPDVVKLLQAIRAADTGELPGRIAETQEARDERKKYVREIARVCQKLYQTALGSFAEGALPLVLGGDHSLGAGSVGAAAEWARRTGDLPTGLLWID